MTGPFAFLLDPIFQPLWLMLIVVLLESLWAWPDKYHPLSLVKLLAMNIASKVHLNVNRSTNQQRISGSLAVAVLLIPVMLTLTVLISLAEFPLFFEALLLLVALQFQSDVKQYKKVYRALAREKKALARSLLSAIVLRETDKLSPMGTAKAAIESLLVRFHYQYCGVLFWYLILGGVGALGYRMVFEFSHCWNIKQPHFKHFGAPAASLMKILGWIPVSFTSGCFAIAENISGWFKGRQRLAKNSLPFSMLLASCGGALGIQLGGPAFYGGQKVRFQKVGGNREIRLADMPRGVAAIRKTQAILLVLCVLSTAMIYAIKGMN